METSPKKCISCAEKQGERHGITSGFMIGDRFHDVEAGLANGLTAVGCLFGTGTREELKRAHYLINCFSELQRIVT